MTPSRFFLFFLVATFSVSVGCSAADERPDEPIVPDPVDVPTPPKTASGPAASVGASVSSSAPTSDAITLEAGEQRYVGTYGFAPASEDHRFQGTWVDVDGGARVILTYGPVPEREAWAGKKVVVVGTPYHPEGRAIAGDHVRPRIVRLADAR